jgi:predicted DNA-binding transcriptional regulator AlpA
LFEIFLVRLSSPREIYPPGLAMTRPALRTAKSAGQIPMTIAVTIPDAVAMSGIGRTSLYKLIGEGKLRPRKLGRRALILVDELEACIRSQPTAEESSD